jgi:hypothetical protein
MEGRGANGGAEKKAKTAMIVILVFLGSSSFSRLCMPGIANCF